MKEKKRNERKEKKSKYHIKYMLFRCIFLLFIFLHLKIYEKYSFIPRLEFSQKVLHLTHIFDHHLSGSLS